MIYRLSLVGVLSAIASMSCFGAADLKNMSDKDLIERFVDVQQKLNLINSQFDEEWKRTGEMLVSSDLEQRYLGTLGARYTPKQKSVLGIPEQSKERMLNENMMKDVAQRLEDRKKLYKEMSDKADEKRAPLEEEKSALKDELEKRHLMQGIIEKF